MISRQGFPGYSCQLVCVQRKQSQETTKRTLADNTTDNQFTTFPDFPCSPEAHEFCQSQILKQTQTAIDNASVATAARLQKHGEAGESPAVESPKSVPRSIQPNFDQNPRGRNCAPAPRARAPIWPWADGRAHGRWADGRWALGVGSAVNIWPYQTMDPVDEERPSAMRSSFMPPLAFTPQLNTTTENDKQGDHEEARPSRMRFTWNTATNDRPSNERSSKAETGFKSMLSMARNPLHIEKKTADGTLKIGDMVTRPQLSRSFRYTGASSLRRCLLASSSIVRTLVYESLPFIVTVADVNGIGLAMHRLLMLPLESRVVLEARGRSQGTTSDKIKDLLRQYDINGDDTLDIEEVTALVEHLMKEERQGKNYRMIIIVSTPSHTYRSLLDKGFRHPVRVQSARLPITGDGVPWLTVGAPSDSRRKAPPAVTAQASTFAYCPVHWSVSVHTDPSLSVSSRTSQYGTVLQIMTDAGTVTLDGELISYSTDLEPVFENAGFPVGGSGASSRRCLLVQGQGTNIAGAYNKIVEIPLTEPLPFQEYKNAWDIAAADKWEAANLTAKIQTSLNEFSDMTLEYPVGQLSAELVPNSPGRGLAGLTDRRIRLSRDRDGSDKPESAGDASADQNRGQILEGRAFYSGWAVRGSGRGPDSKHQAQSSRRRRNKSGEEGRRAGVWLQQPPPAEAPSTYSGQRERGPTLNLQQDYPNLHRTNWTPTLAIRPLQSSPALAARGLMSNRTLMPRDAVANLNLPHRLPKPTHAQTDPNRCSHSYPLQEFHRTRRLDGSWSPARIKRTRISLRPLRRSPARLLRAPVNLTLMQENAEFTSTRLLRAPVNLTLMQENAVANLNLHTGLPKPTHAQTDPNISHSSLMQEFTSTRLLRAPVNLTLMQENAEFTSTRLLRAPVNLTLMQENAVANPNHRRLVETFQRRRLQQYPEGFILPVVNWTQQGKVTPVKNQGACGSCWAYAAVGALESSYLITTDKFVSSGQDNSVIDLSEGQVISCTNYQSNQYFQSMGCDGGDPYEGLAYATYFDVGTESILPDTAKNTGKTVVCDTVTVRNLPLTKIVKSAEEPLYAYPFNDEIAFQKAVMLQPIAIFFEVDDAFMNYKGGIYLLATRNTFTN
eukprot:gene27482-4788_t